MTDIPVKLIMTIPGSRSQDTVDVIFTVITTLIVTVSCVCAVIDICLGLSLIASLIWLVFWAWWLWSTHQDPGGLRKLWINWLECISGRRFAEAALAEAQPPVIHFGFHLFGRCFIQQTISLDDIESVEWSTGQATGLAGRDMNDWYVWIWFDHHDPRLREKRSIYGNPDQDLYGVGLSGRREKTEAFGLSLVAFLRDAGADLIPSPMLTRFIRRQLLPEHRP